MYDLTHPSDICTAPDEQWPMPGDKPLDETQPMPGGYRSAPESAQTLQRRLGSGDVLCGRFRIVQFLATGGMGEVYEAADEHLQGKHVALKTLRADLADDPVARTRFEREVLLAREISHINVCPTYDIFRDASPERVTIFFTMKLVRGESLAAKLKRENRIAIADAYPLIRQMAAALDAAHRAGVIHRDFKPGNVMLEKGDRELRVLVTDFGLSRAYDAENTLAETGHLSGTLGYLAPELLHGHSASPASDVYGFGVVLYEALTGNKPVNRPRTFTERIAPSRLIDGLPSAWDRVILGCLEFDPARRFQSAGIALDALDDNVSRRRALKIGVTALATAAAGSWFGWPELDSLLHPLPPKRFVALMAWPPVDSSPVRSLLAGLLDAIRDRLARAEAYVKDLLVISARDVNDQPPPAAPKDAVSSLGANLVLAASLDASASGYTLLLKILDASTANILRHGKISSASAEPGVLADKASDLAARLLDVPVKPLRSKEQDELASLQPGAYLAFSDAEELKSQPNDAGLDSAIDKYQKALELDPHFSLAYAKLAIAYIRKFQVTRDKAALELAAKNAQFALKYSANSTTGVLADALVLLYSGHTEEARGRIAKAQSLDPGNPEIAFYEAFSYRFLGQWRQSEKAWKDLIAARPNFWPAYNDLGWTLHREGRYQEAADIFRQAAVAAPRVAMPLANAGTMYLLLDRKKEAMEAFEASLKRYPNELAYLSLGNLSWETGKYAEALGFYQKAAGLKPGDDMIWRNIGDCYAMLGRPLLMKENYAKAASVMTDQLRTNPSFGVNWMTLAFYEAKLGHRQEAETDMKTAEARGATDLESQFTKAQALALLGDKQQALDLVLSCVEAGLSPVEVELALDLGEVRADARYRKLAAQRRASKSTL
jgi:eukaryotic-like serine/threonine-protein kinase